MRRMLAVLPMLLCLLCACGGKEKTVQATMDFRTGLLAAGGCGFHLEAAEDLDGLVWEFALDCACGTDGTAALTVTAPEGVAGITARMEGGTGKLCFDGTVAAFGLAKDARLAPLAVPATLVRAWTEGYIASSGPDGNETLAVYELGWDEDCMKVFTWFGPDGTPTRAELSLGGEVLCKTEITGFRTEAGYGGSNETAEENLG